MAPLRSVHEGDVVLVDIRGRVFFALVKAKDTGGLTIAPIDNRINWHSCTARQVVDVYRKVRRAS